MTIVPDLAKGLMALRHGFERHHLTPVAVDLGSWEDGNALLRGLDSEHMHYVEKGIHPATGEMVNQCTIVGIIVRWPTKRIALPRGGFEFI